MCVCACERVVNCTQVRTVYRSSIPTLNDAVNSPAGLLSMGWEWLRGGGGPLEMAPTPAIAFGHSGADSWSSPSAAPEEGKGERDAPLLNRRTRPAQLTESTRGGAFREQQGGGRGGRTYRCTLALGLQDRERRGSVASVPFASWMSTRPSR
jgi:hypothetical protein